jgi:hypothetical protein
MAAPTILKTSSLYNSSAIQLSQKIISELSVQFA